MTTTRSGVRDVTTADTPAGSLDRRDDRDQQQTPAYLRPLAVVDGSGSALLGIVLVVAPGWLASGLGLATQLPIQLFGLLFVLNGLANGRAAWRRTWGSVATCVVIDLMFAGLLLGLVAADPWASETWARWSLAGLGLLSLDLGAAKLWAVRRGPA